MIYWSKKQNSKNNQKTKTENTQTVCGSLRLGMGGMSIFLVAVYGCVGMYEVGRPVLVGTTTIEKSELLAALLSEYQVPYNLLNARPENVESESKTIAQAGCKKAVTIATNMAGRGTDILLGGNPAFLIRSLIKNYF